jgi:signal transduction histidine kinase
MNAPPWHRSLAARHGLVLLACVTAGSLLLVAWLAHQQRAESRREFATLARRHADFVRRLNLPRSAKLAGDLRELLGLEIHFRARHTVAGGGVLPADLPERTEEPVRLAGGREAIVLPLDAAHDMVFLRDEPSLTLSLRRPETRHALLAFWGLSAAVAWLGARQVVRPVMALTRVLPGFFSREGEAPPEVARADEVGQLARALTEARIDLQEERRRREQSERLALLGRVATGLAHEIKNPLASIQLHAQLVDCTVLDADSARSLGHVREEAEAIEGLVNQWLFLARPAPPQTAGLDLRELVADTLDTLAAPAVHAGVTLDWEPGSAVPVRVDRVRLRQALRNVLLNALQAMPGGGTVGIRLEIRDGHACLAVHDQGAGFSAAALEQATALFYTEKEGGMGVGLNVASEIVSAHGGSLAVKNHPWGGALVEMVLPCEIATRS